MEHTATWNSLTLVKKSAMCHLFPYCLKTLVIASIITEPVRGCRKATWSTKKNRKTFHPFFLLYLQLMFFYWQLKHGKWLWSENTETFLQQCWQECVWGHDGHGCKLKKHLSLPGDLCDNWHKTSQQGILFNVHFLSKNF